MIKNKQKILVTGREGQLGQCIKKVSYDYLEDIEFYFANSQELDITNRQLVNYFFTVNDFKYVINCAAYTNVEKAEKESEKAFLVNADGVKNLASACKEYGSILIHISTDYVFDGTKKEPYTENDTVNPINEYGKSKLLGEQYIQEILDTYFIIRTSWLYSQFGKNFFKIIIDKIETEKELTITVSEKGTPTNANDLARSILDIISFEKKEYGIYHYSNQGEATWYDFAREIVKLSGKIDIIKLSKTDNFPTSAKRPKYSLLDKSKIKKELLLDILEWEISLKSILFNS